MSLRRSSRLTRPLSRQAPSSVSCPPFQGPISSVSSVGTLSSVEEIPVADSLGTMSSSAPTPRRAAPSVPTAVSSSTMDDNSDGIAFVPVSLPTVSATSVSAMASGIVHVQQFEATMVFSLDMFLNVNALSQFIESVDTARSASATNNHAEVIQGTVFFRNKKDPTALAVIQDNFSTKPSFLALFPDELQHNDPNNWIEFLRMHLKVLVADVRAHVPSPGELTALLHKFGLLAIATFSGARGIAALHHAYSVFMSNLRVNVSVGGLYKQQTREAPHKSELDNRIYAFFCALASPFLQHSWKSHLAMLANSRRHETVNSYMSYVETSMKELEVHSRNFVVDDPRAVLDSHFRTASTKQQTSTKTPSGTNGPRGADTPSKDSKSTTEKKKFSGRSFNLTPSEIASFTSRLAVRQCLACGEPHTPTHQCSSPDTTLLAKARYFVYHRGTFGASVLNAPVSTPPTQTATSANPATRPATNPSTTPAARQTRNPAQTSAPNSVSALAAPPSALEHRQIISGLLSRTGTEPPVRISAMFDTGNFSGLAPELHGTIALVPQSLFDQHPECFYDISPCDPVFRPLLTN